ncbi:MAG: LON peptidase substrate-binding domain-containing protein [Chloroflexota bacterium]|nr:LON peptidase substrate-binding domain-containing protein [Chloroflexota bacterium]MDE2894112.1 LON peptidase substrate-binding domain-containing protein [Chloroflexota bacterium]
MPELPLFPLQIVVFPGESVPLHIFEPRYRQLVKDTLQTGDPFGIVLTRRSRQQPTSEDREPTHEVGCTVRMESNEAFPDGRFNIGCIGERRFRIIEKLGERPYWVADVEYLDDPNDSESAEAYGAHDATSALYREHLGLALALQNSWQRSYRLPGRPNPLVNHVASSIEAPASVKQEVLKSESTVEQLNLLSRILRASNRQLTDRVHLHHKQRYEGLGVGN